MAEMAQKKTSVLAVLSLVFGCFFIIPFLGVLFSIPAVILGIAALVAISKEGNNLKGKGLAIGGIILGVLGIVIISFVALLSVVAIPNLLRARISANDYSAKANIRTISTAIETYAISNNGKYPVSESSLSPYLPRRYGNEAVNGYRYLLNLNYNSYSIVAKP